MTAYRIFPSKLLVLILLFFGAGNIVVTLTSIDGIEEASSALLIVLIIFGTIDFARLWNVPKIDVSRHLSSNLALNRWSKVELTIASNFKSARSVEFYDEIDSTLDSDQLPVSFELPSNSEIHFSYRIKPRKRGAVAISIAQVKIGSDWRLWKGVFRIECESKAKVYPDFSSIAHYILLTTTNHTDQLGIKRQPPRGEGTEFNNLREYRRGDTLRQINWKATSRFKKLISQEYHHESDQQIVVMLDTGRRMLTKDEGVSHFDQALNALILVSYIALRMGDAIGVMSFGKTSRWVAPNKGSQQSTNILKSLYDLQADTTGSDYEQAVVEFLKYQKKRSLVVLLTNLRDEDTSDLTRALHLLREKHTILVANLQESILDQEQRREVQDLDGALRYCGIHKYLNACRQTQQQLSASGILNFTCSGPSLAATLANSYLEIKGARIL